MMIVERHLPVFIKDIFPQFHVLSFNCLTFLISRNYRWSSNNTCTVNRYNKALL
jgi:hypothetical protein